MSMRWPVFFTLFLTILVILSGCADDKLAASSDDVARSDFCTEQDPCPISIYALLSDPSRWNEKYVSTMGYVSYGRSKAIFADQFSSDNSILRNGVELVVDERYYDENFAATDVVRPVKGLFKVKELQKGHLGQVNEYDFVGVIESARIIPFSADAWSCESASESIKARYLKRGEPCVGHKFDRDRAR